MASNPSKQRGNVDELFPDFPVNPGMLDEQGRFITAGLTREGGVPEQKILPSLDAMGQLSNAELQAVLDHYGVGQPWESLKSDMYQYVARMTEMTDKAAIRAEVERLFDPQGPLARRHMLGMARRVDQTWSMLEAAEGNPAAEFVWITEFDDRVCEGCEGNGGDIMTLAEWQAGGLPGPAVCYGGNSCRCDLVRVTD